MPAAPNALSLREALRLCGADRLADNPVEQAEAWAKARREILRQRPQLSAEAIDRETAGSLGLGLAKFQEAMALRELGAEVRDLVADRELTVGQALALSPLAETRRQRSLAREAIAHNLAPATIGRAAALLIEQPNLRVRAAVERARRLGPTGDAPEATVAGRAERRAG